MTEENQPSAPAAQPIADTTSQAAADGVSAGAPTQTDAASSAASAAAHAATEKPDESPIVIDEVDEPSAGDVVVVEPAAPPKAVRVAGHASMSPSAETPAEPPVRPPPTPPAVEAEDKADPWGHAKHEAHKAEIRSMPLTKRVEFEGGDRKLSEAEYVEAFLRHAREFAIEEYAVYAMLWDDHHPAPAGTP